MAGARRHLTESRLEELAGETAFNRGKKYFHDGQVETIVETGNGFSAVVLGNRTYHVDLVLRGRRVEHDCTCPVGERSEFCKHLVAASLAWLKGASQKPARPTPYDSVRAWLEGQDKDALAKLIFERAVRDGALLRQLLIEAARSGTSGAPDLRRLFDDAVRIRGYIVYEDAPAYFTGLMDVLDEFDRAIATQPAEVANLCEHAMRRVKEAAGRVDDSDGGLIEALERIAEVHLKACTAARPAPTELAARLLQLELASEYGEFAGALESYAEVLGDAGTAEYIRLAREAWDKLPALTPQAPVEGRMAGRRFRAFGHNGEAGNERTRYALTRIMKALAWHEGGFDSLLEVLRKDLSDASNYIEIVDACRLSKRFELALEWSQRGVEAFKDGHYPGLDILLAEELRRAGRHAEAVEITWSLFTDRPGMASFQVLQEFSGALEDPQRWRDRAVGYLRKTFPAAEDWYAMEARTLLVQIFMAEGSTEMALAEAETGPCRWETLEALAAACEAGRPEDSLGLYTRLVAAILESTTGRSSTPNESYRKAVELMLMTARLHERLDQLPAFETWLNQIRAKYRPKRNFMKLLDKTKWPTAGPSA